MSVSFTGVRSLTFTDDILTIGTGVGVILFFDIRAGRYLESECGHACSLNVGSGWLVRNVHFVAFSLHSLLQRKYWSQWGWQYCMNWNPSCVRGRFIYICTSNQQSVYACSLSFSDMMRHTGTFSGSQITPVLFIPIVTTVRGLVCLRQEVPYPQDCGEITLVSGDRTVITIQESAIYLFD